MILAAAALAGTALASTVLASGTTNSTSTINDVEPGLLGFLVVAGMGVVLVFLLRSMNKQFRKIGPKPEEDELPDGTVSGEVLSREDGWSTADATSAD
ncbi:MAG TPA: hypothetical protein VHZ03_03160 [Trebonia sp.]|jgi:hypothetical protein|nr:hypothetical protein [Trebonia sp.]